MSKYYKSKLQNLFGIEFTLLWPVVSIIIIIILPSIDMFPRSLKLR